MMGAATIAGGHCDWAIGTGCCSFVEAVKIAWTAATENTHTHVQIKFKLQIIIFICTISDSLCARVTAGL